LFKEDVIKRLIIEGAVEKKKKKHDLKDEKKYWENNLVLIHNFKN